ncbi:MAG: IS66 family insertion sequence element accessory protein TnpB [Deltaproteobacteria bacterium]|nr:IS66 family insertion sequence element accessory protein TnpB [Deltaproteobacteria bacterium]MCB9229950.1 IS66 family insertion sequence element accessory protein TnpB [Deltaproteobacteria bacterium]
MFTKASPFGGFPNVRHAYMYPKPVPMNWGEKKLIQLCKEEMGIDPALGGLFIFFNKKKDQMKLFFLDDTGSQEFQKLLPKGGFILPVAKDGEKFVKIERNKLDKLFKSL